jgi:hypothetical protein
MIGCMHALVRQPRCWSLRGIYSSASGEVAALGGIAGYRLLLAEVQMFDQQYRCLTSSTVVVGGAAISRTLALCHWAGQGVRCGLCRGGSGSA